MKRIYRNKKIYIRNMQKEPVVLHSDNGSPMKGTTMLVKLTVIIHMMVIMVIRTTITEVSIGLQKIFKETTSIKIYCIHSMYL